MSNTLWSSCAEARLGFAGAPDSHRLPVRLNYNLFLNCPLSPFLASHGTEGATPRPIPSSIRGVLFLEEERSFLKRLERNGHGVREPVGVVSLAGQLLQLGVF